VNTILVVPCSNAFIRKYYYARHNWKFYGFYFYFFYTFNSEIYMVLVHNVTFHDTTTLNKCFNCIIVLFLFPYYIVSYFAYLNQHYNYIGHGFGYFVYCFEMIFDSYALFRMTKNCSHFINHIYYGFKFFIDYK